MSDILWRLEGVCLKGNSPYRLENVSIEVREGITAVLGCSGAGKTSLLNLLVGYETPDSGSVVNLCAARGHSLPLYWVPQEYGLWPHLTARRHLEMVAPGEGSASRGRGAACCAPTGNDPAIRPDGDEVERLLAEFDIAHKADSRPGEMSQGERARLAIARALMAGATVLVMDEPLSSVDPARAGRFWRVIRRRLAERKASLIYTTHLPEMVLGEADRVICLKEGKVLAEGGVNELYEHPPTREVAECFGYTNWLEADECRLWLGEDAAQARSIRPERLELLLLNEHTQGGAGCPQPAEQARWGQRAPPVQPPADSALHPLLRVESSRPKGAVVESDLRHDATGARRTFRHRPPAGPVAAGARVMLRLCALMLAALVIAGCDKDTDPKLRVSEVKHWNMPPDGTSIPAPRAMAVADGEVYALDTVGRCLVFDSTGKLKREWRMPEYSVGRPEAILMLRDGRMAVADTHYHRVLFFDRKGTLLGQLGEYGTGPGQFIYPVDLAEDDSGNLYVCEYGGNDVVLGNDRAQKFGPDGRFIASFGGFGTEPGQFQRPSGMVWHKGRLYVADALNNRISIFEDTGKYAGILGGDNPPKLALPYDICLARDGTFYVVEYNAGRVTRLSLDGKVLGRFGSSGAEKGKMATPWGMAVDAQMHVLIADTGNRRIVELVP